MTATSGTTLVVTTPSASAMTPPPDLILHKLPNDMLNCIFHFLTPQNATSAKRVCKQFQVVVRNRWTSRVQVASAHLDQTIKAEKTALQALLSQTRTTWCGWLVHQLSNHNGCAGKIRQVVHAIFSFVSSSFSLESDKQRLIQARLDLDYRTAENTILPYWLRDSSPLMAMPWGKDVEAAYQNYSDAKTRYFEETKNLSAVTPLLQFLDNEKQFHRLPLLEIRPQGGDLLDVVQANMTHPAMRGSVIYKDGERPFFAVSLKKTDREEYQLRVYYERGVRVFSYIVEWYVESANSTNFRNTSTQCVVAHDAVKEQAEPWLREIQQLLTRKPCESGWMLALPPRK